MAGGQSSWLAAQLAAAAAGGVTWTPPDSVYLGLWTATLDRDSDGDTAGEAAYTGYARTEIGTGNNQDDAWDPPDDDGSSVTVRNMGEVAFPICTAGSATIISGAVLDADESGHILWWFDISSISITSGITPTLAASALEIQDTA